MLNKCLFPVAGYGTRFLPATKSMPKEMLPILDKPLIQYGVEEASAAGLRDIGFVTGRGKRAIEDHFDVSYELEDQVKGTEKERALLGIRDLINECTFSYTRQVQMQGLGHAILCGRSIMGDEPFAVVLADDLCFGEGGGVLAQMLEIFAQHRTSVVAIEEVPAEITHQYGVIAGDEVSKDLYSVSNMIEKPEPGTAPSNLAIIGRYILTPDIFEILGQTPPDKRGEIQITDALVEQAKQGGVLAYRFKGKRFDCGSLAGYVQATNFCYEKLLSKGEK
ncbi:MAG TPA: UTP--glucose-1-phosphate uridylyltransferase GalU [Pseudomonadales bacterium]|nr:UTP--glucose-1-phosphate uridylyltransferase GalU [Pseudomonadales bacterium]